MEINQNITESVVQESNPPTNKTCPSCGYDMGHLYTRLSGSRLSVSYRNVNHGSKYHTDRRPIVKPDTLKPKVPFIATYFKCLSVYCKHVEVMPVMDVYKSTK